MGNQPYVPAALTWETDRVLNVQEAAWDPGPVWKISPPPTGIRTPEPPVRSELLFRLRAPRQYQTLRIIIIIIIIIIMQCNNNFTGKYLAIIGPKLSGPPENPGY
jgi:hypothetical protein